MGRGTAENSHKLSEDSGHCINGGYDSKRFRIKNSEGKLHICEARMVHKNKAWFIFSNKIHSLGGIGKFYLFKGGFNNNADHRCKKFAWFQRSFMFKSRELKHLLIAHLFCIYFHFVTSCSGFLPNVLLCNILSHNLSFGNQKSFLLLSNIKCFQKNDALHLMLIILHKRIL